MIKNFKLFETYNKPEIDENTIRVENKERESYIDFYFEDGILIYIDNKWHFNVPNWVGHEVPVTGIKYWAHKEDKRFEVYYLLGEIVNKYNI